MVVLVFHLWLVSVIEVTTPLALVYPRPGTETPEFVQFGGVGDTNQAPELTALAASIEDLSNKDSDIIEGLNFSQYFADPDGDTLSFSATCLPPGLSINPFTGIITGTIDHSASQGGIDGVYNVVVSVSDPSGDTTSLSFNWTTTNPPPESQNDTTTTEENTVVKEMC